jgi:hypothetical protein
LCGIFSSLRRRFAHGATVFFLFGSASGRDEPVATASDEQSRMCSNSLESKNDG